MELKEEIRIGMVIANRKIYALTEEYCIAECTVESPEPYVVWNIDYDKKGVCCGKYFEERMDAEWEFCSRVFEWFQDNVSIEMIENENAKKSQHEAVKKNEKEMSHIDFLKWVLKVFND